MILKFQLSGRTRASAHPVSPTRYRGAVAALAAATFAVAAAVTAGPASAAVNRYIAPSGTDTGSCTQSAPCRTVHFASSQLRAGDFLYARGGTYSGQAGQWRSASGTATAPITFRNYPGETPIFDGAGSGGNFLNVVGTDWLVIDGITVRNYRGTAGIWMGYSGSGTDRATNNTIRNSSFFGIGDDNQKDHAIYVSHGVKDVTIDSNTIIGSSGAGLHFYHSPGIVGASIHNNVIKGGYWGMVFRNGATDLRISHNTVIGARYGIDMAGDTRNATVRNNIFSGNSSMTMAAASVSNNLFWATPASGAGAVTADPRFVDAAGDDFHLQATSPGVDKAAHVGVVSDRDGLARPQGPAPDFGAYERVAGTPASSLPAPAGLVRVDAGATLPHTDASGVSWAADAYFTGGRALDRGTSVAIAGTSNDRMYQSERYGMSAYTIPVTNGAHTVTLGFAENSVGGPGQRVFDVSLNGQTVVDDLDIYAQAGARAALVKSFPVTVSDGRLVIGFAATKGAAVVQTIEVR